MAFCPACGCDGFHAELQTDPFDEERDLEVWSCHFCGFHLEPVEICPECGETDCDGTCMAYLLVNTDEPEPVGEDPLLESARLSAEAHLDSIHDDLEPEVYAAELRRITAAEYARMKAEDRS